MNHKPEKNSISSPSEIEKKIRSLRKSKRLKEIDELVRNACKKLDPVMTVLLDNNKNYDHYLTKQEYENVLTASTIIKEVIEIFESSGMKTDIKYLDFELERINLNVNKKGNIFVDTIMLIQLIDLYNILENIKIFVEKIRSSSGINSIVQTTESLTSFDVEEELSDVSDPNKFTLMLTEDDQSIIDMLNQEYFVFPSTTEVDNREKPSDINNVQSANKVVIKCIYNLQEVSKYLGIEKKDVYTVCSRAEVEDVHPHTSERRHSPVHKAKEDTVVVGNKCSCADCMKSRTDGEECEDDKIIICIKGRNQDEGDVKIVIRQCPDCKNSEGKDDSKKRAKPHPPTPDTQSQKSVKLDEKHPSESSKSYKSQPSAASSQHSQSVHDSDSEPHMNEPALGRTRSRESTRSEKSQKSVVIQDEPEYKSKISQPGDLRLAKSDRSVHSTRSSSPVTSIKSEQDQFKEEDKYEEERHAPEPKTETFIQHQAKYSNINLFETTNLCLKTETGQDLIISLTVTLQEFENKKLSLRDIFSEDEYANKGQQYPPDQYPPDQTMVVEDHFIPLERTKVCSSLDFDVTVEDSKMRDKGLKNKNAQIVVKLNDFGIDNLLRACRPAKCCRKSVLNEKMKKCMPYPPSLRSLPLDDSDYDVIHQSLQMSLQKVKNSTNLKKEYYVNHVNPVHTVMYFHIETADPMISSKIKNVKEYFVKEKLNYYINLVKDFKSNAREGIQNKNDNNLLGTYKTTKCCSKYVLNKEIKMLQLGKKHYENVMQISCKNHYSHGINNIHTVMYFQVETNLPGVPTKKRPINKCFVKQKLNYYINLAKDSGCNSKKSKSKYDVLYVDMRDKSDKNIKNEVVKKCSGESSTSRWTKFLNYDEIPIVSKQTVADQNDLFSPLTENQSSDKHLKTKRKTVPRSKIPVFQKHSPQKNGEAKTLETEIYCISLSSLPENKDLASRIMNGIKKSSTIETIEDNAEKLLKIKKDKPLYAQKSVGPSNYSMLSNRSVKHHKKKKKQYYLSRSKSETSLNIRSAQLKNRKNQTLKQKVTKTILDTNYVNSNQNILKSEDLTQLIINCFSELVYNMVSEKILNELRLENVIRNPINEKYCHVQVSTTGQSLMDMYDTAQKSTSASILEIKQYHLNTSFHDLKAKQSQSCIFFIGNNIKNSLICGDLAIQTSRIFGTNVQCQTSQTLVSYKKDLKPEVKRQKHKLFSAIYDGEALTGIPNSCDQLENFIVLFKSLESFTSEVFEKDLSLIDSVQSFESTRHSIHDSLSSSLLKLKETLERYEVVKKEIKQRENINPIEYFVYQMCACNRVQKKPSVVQRILSKTKGLFSSTQCNKRQKTWEPSMIRDTDICQHCGCNILKCHNKNANAAPLSACSCPSETKTEIIQDSKKYRQPCCKTEQNKPKKISRIACEHLAKIKSYVQCSVSSILKKDQLQPCTCPIKNGTDAKGSSNEISKTDQSHDTKDSSTQKCACQKCENFSEDGTCCCSHCQGCLDKSLEAKPNNNDAGILCKCSKEELEKSKSKNNNNAIVNYGIVTIDRDMDETKHENFEQLDTENVDNTNVVLDTVDSNVTSSFFNNDSNNTAAYYVIASPAMMSSLSLESANPFCQYLINMSPVNR
ncbi:uncharacterized protein LOC115881317 [Sitophilus oryzae]|uniref:Uncharacterized protein LOC115881317 n=1 Tax=Sitophilus oryzae TaxID=7048 RepID=A0A6J2XSX8_SITOR|nr:uncharacterized protein LOC115881317 [Sitophilus oryzae]